MNHYFSAYIILFNIILCNAQKEINYFPQEQLIHIDCRKTPTPSTCLYAHYQNALKEILKPHIANPENFKNDTINIQLSFKVDKKGFIIRESIGTRVTDSILRKRIKTNLVSLLENPIKFEVLNKKKDKYEPTHNLSYSLTTSNFNFIPSNKIYNGADIFEAPSWPSGCSHRYGKKGRICFNQQIREHIRKHFRYPEEAQKLGLQGKVSILFKINKKGEVYDLRTRGPHKILEDEAARIIKLLPKLQSAAINGKPVKVPFSIPITFKLK